MKPNPSVWRRALVALPLFSLLLATGCTERNQAAESRASAEADHAEQGLADRTAAEPGADSHAGGEEHEQETGEEGVALSSERQRAQGIVVAPLEPQRLQETLRAAAEIGFNESRRVTVAARAAGWAEKVNAYANERVQENALLAEIYSPEFATSQQEYLLILDRATGGGLESGATSLLADAGQRLRLLGLTQAEIQELARNRTPYPYLHVHSPIRGTVVEHRLNPGDTVELGQLLYVIADLSTVWASISLTETQLNRVRPGQKVTLTVKTYPDERFPGQIESIGAEMDETTRTVKARALIRNTAQRLRPGMFAEAEIAIGDGAKALTLPEDAVMRNADGDWMVYVEEEPGHFEPMEVKVLRSVDNRVVLDGVKPGTRVVTKGAFFVHSERAKGGFEVHSH